MKTLFFDCAMGAAGDMLAASLLELLPDPRDAIARANTIGLDGVEICAEESSKCGINGTHVRVKIDGEEESHHHHEHGDHYDQGHDHHHEHDHDHDHHHEHEHKHDHDHHHEHKHKHDHDHEHKHEHDHHHHDHEHEHHHHHDHKHAHCGLGDIERTISSLKVSERVKSDALSVYRTIAEAESAAHGAPVDQIHFHEVGTMDAIADVVFVSMLIEMLAPDEICTSPINVGSGHVRCAHGILPVPAPATAHILRGVPIYSGHVASELCTPTGAALLKHFSDRSCPMPLMTVDRIGYGMGTKDFEAANCVRAFIGESEDRSDSVVELTFTVDDMTGESIGFALEELWASGILEAYTIPISMKKSRPGILFCVMCREADRERVTRAIFRHTSTIGLRETVSRRRVLDRTISVKKTGFGDLRVKASSGYGAKKQKIEHEDLARIAREHGMTLDELRDALRY